MMLTASVSSPSSSVAFVSSHVVRPVALWVLRVSSGGASRPARRRKPGRSSRATGEPSSRVMSNRPGELAGLGGEDLLDALGAEQLRGGLVRVDDLAAHVVDGDRLGQRGEDPLEALARVAQLVDELGVGQAARRALAERGEEGDLPVRRRSLALEPEAEAAEQGVAVHERDVHPPAQIRPLHLLDVAGRRGERLGGPPRRRR